MARVDRSKRFELTESTPVEQRPQIWVDGRQQRRFKIGPYVAVSLAMAKRDLLPDMIETEARLRGFGRQVRAGEARLRWTTRLGRFAPEQDQVAGWVDALAEVVAGARVRLDGRERDDGEAVDPAYADLVRRPAPARPVRPRRAAEVLAAVQRPVAGLEAGEAAPGVDERVVGPSEADLAPQDQVAPERGSRAVGLTEADLAPLGGAGSGLEAQAIGLTEADLAPLGEAGPALAAGDIGLTEADLAPLGEAAFVAEAEPLAARLAEVLAGEPALPEAEVAVPGPVEPEPAGLDPDLAAIRLALGQDDPIPDLEEEDKPPALAAKPAAPVRVVQDHALPSWLKDWQPPEMPDAVEELPAPLPHPTPVVISPPRKPSLPARMGRSLAPLARSTGRGLVRLARMGLHALIVALRPVGRLLLDRLARVTHVAACWFLLSLLMIIAVPKGAYHALIYHLDGGDLADWS